MHGQRANRGSWEIPLQVFPRILQMLPSNFPSDTATYWG